MHVEEVERIDLPHGGSGHYDHADVHHPTGRVFLANTELGQIEVLDGPGFRHVATVPGCAGASGVAVVGEQVVAAARETGEILVISPTAIELVSRFAVGPSPNGLAWDGARERLLVADTSTFTVDLFDLEDGRCVATQHLAGRPRWAASDPTRDAFLVNVRDPAAVSVLSAEDLRLTESVEIDAIGPHGLGIDCITDTALVACDDATLVWLGLDGGRVCHRSPLSGGPDVVWVDATRRTAYVAVGDPGMLHVFDLDSRDEITRIRTAPGAKTSALDEERGRLYVFLPGVGQAVVYSLDAAA